MWLFSQNHTLMIIFILYYGTYDTSGIIEFSLNWWWPGEQYLIKYKSIKVWKFLIKEQWYGNTLKVATDKKDLYSSSLTWSPIENKNIHG